MKACQPEAQIKGILSSFEMTSDKNYFLFKPFKFNLFPYLLIGEESNIDGFVCRRLSHFDKLNVTAAGAIESASCILH